MGWFDGRPSYSRSSSHHGSHYGSHSHSRHGSHSHSTSGFFGSARPTYSRAGSSYSRSSSYYKRRPRDGYINRLIYKLKQLLRDLLYYARRNPMKLFFLVIMPLITGGALHQIARQFGIRLPAMFQGHGARRYSGGYYGSRGYGGSSFGGLFGGGHGGSSLGGMMSIARAFM